MRAVGQPVVADLGGLGRMQDKIGSECRAGDFCVSESGFPDSLGVLEKRQQMRGGDVAELADAIALKPTSTNGRSAPFLRVWLALWRLTSRRPTPS